MGDLKRPHDWQRNNNVSHIEEEQLDQIIFKLCVCKRCGKLGYWATDASGNYLYWTWDATYMCKGEQ